MYAVSHQACGLQEIMLLTAFGSQALVASQLKLTEELLAVEVLAGVGQDAAWQVRALLSINHVNPQHLKYRFLLVQSVAILLLTYMMLMTHSALNTRSKKLSEHEYTQ